MKGKTHLAFGVATGVSTALMLSNYISTTQQVSLLSGCLVGSLIVDIDNDKSTIGYNLRPISTIIQGKFGHRMLVHAPIFWIILYFILNKLIFLTNNYVSQRTNVLLILIGICGILSFFARTKDKLNVKKVIKKLTIFVFIPLIACFICTKELNFALYGLTVGVFGHLLLDLFTKGGLPLLYPIKFKNKKGEKHVKKFSLLPLKTGTWFETIVALILFIGYFYLLNIYVDQIAIQNIYNPFLIFSKLIRNL